MKVNHAQQVIQAWVTQDKVALAVGNVAMERKKSKMNNALAKAFFVRV